VISGPREAKNKRSKEEEKRCHLCLCQLLC
jgi:hypothetical protein